MSEQNLKTRQKKMRGRERKRSSKRKQERTTDQRIVNNIIIVWEVNTRTWLLHVHNQRVLIITIFSLFSSLRRFFFYFIFFFCFLVAVIVSFHSSVHRWWFVCSVWTLMNSDEMQLRTLKKNTCKPKKEESEKKHDRMAATTATTQNGIETNDERWATKIQTAKINWKLF